MVNLTGETTYRRTLGLQIHTVTSGIRHAHANKHATASESIKFNPQTQLSHFNIRVYLPVVLSVARVYS